VTRQRRAIGVSPDGPRFTERHVRVLHAVAESYIRTAHPVPSQHVASQLDVSSATVRNDFGALEEGGLLQQPHTSAGRIPTAEGFRYYAASYLPPRRLPKGSCRPRTWPRASLATPCW
jgi:heat-inducible transcriptional repressor